MIQYRAVLMVPVVVDMTTVDDKTAQALAKDEIRKYMMPSRSQPAPFLLELQRVGEVAT